MSNASASLAISSYIRQQPSGYKFTSTQLTSLFPELSKGAVCAWCSHAHQRAYTKIVGFEQGIKNRKRFIFEITDPQADSRRYRRMAGVGRPLGVKNTGKSNTLTLSTVLAPPTQSPAEKLLQFAIEFERSEKKTARRLSLSELTTEELLSELQQRMKA